MAVIKNKLSHLVLALALALGGCSAEGEGVSLELGGARVALEVAATPAERARGLSGRASLEEDHGMVFVFAVPTHACFWMHETYIELDAAFVSPAGELLAIATMAPDTRERHCAPAAASWVIELAGGWFARHGLEAGDRLSAASLAKLRDL